MDKSARGAVFVVGGSREAPGGVLLAGTAALRVGAGRVVLATVDSVAIPGALAIPEARMIGLPEHGDGSLDLGAAARDGRLREVAAQVDVVLLGTGCTDGAGWDRVVRTVRDDGDAAIVIDAGALPALRADAGLGPSLEGRGVATPNPSELARLLGREEAVVRDHPEQAIDDAVARLAIVVALRGADTWIGDPDGRRFVARDGHPALATAGSGDVLAGALSGLVARGAGVLGGTLWAVHAHATAGTTLAARHGLGLLARELPEALATALGS